MTNTGKGNDILVDIFITKKYSTFKTDFFLYSIFYLKTKHFKKFSPIFN